MFVQLLKTSTAATAAACVSPLSVAQTSANVRWRMASTSPKAWTPFAVAPRCWPNAFERLLAASFIFGARCGCICARFGWRSHGAAGCLANATAGWHDLPNTEKRHLDAVELIMFFDDEET